MTSSSFDMFEQHIVRRLFANQKKISKSHDHLANEKESKPTRRKGSSSIKVMLDSDHGGDVHEPLPNAREATVRDVHDVDVRSERRGNEANRGDH